MTTLKIENVVKRFSAREALSGVSLEIHAGECVALLGHNGAGKTTLIHSVLGLLSIDSGNISVMGAAPGSLAARRCTAFLPETVAFHRLLTAREQLQAFARIRGEPKSAVDSLLDRVGLDKDAHRRIGTYSKGMRQRLGLAQALLGQPGLVLLDEPTSGLDPVARWDFYSIVKELSDRGAAVVLSSHALTEIETHNDRIVMLRNGKLVAEGDMDALRAKAALPVRLRIAARDNDASVLLSTFGGSRVNGRSIELFCDPSDKMARIADVTAHADIVHDVEVQAPSLDDLYRHFSNREA